VRREWALTLSDVLRHRTRALILDAAVSMEIAPVVAGLMARELGRGPEWAVEQVRQYRELARTYLAQ
jgi:glycerol-3-phosphate dehydrogenase